MATKKTYQFLLKEEECKLFRDLRQLQKSSIDSLGTSNNPKLSQNLTISIHAGNRTLGQFDVDAALGLGVIHEFACIGADSLHKLINTEAGQNNDSAISNQDSRGNEHLTVNQTENEQAKLFDVLSFIDSINLTVSEENMRNPICAEMIKAQFPDAIITIKSSTSAERDRNDIVETEKSSDIQQIVSEVDDVDNTIESKLKLTTLEEHAITTTAKGISSSSQRLDPIIHLNHLANYATDPPATDEFGHNHLLPDSWNTLPYARRLEIAHARAIQRHYGKVVENGGCSYCTENGWECRVYRTQLANLSHMNFGQSCQNCRLSQATCDLPAASSSLHQQTFTTPQKTLTADEQDTPNSSSGAAIRKPSLLSRMSAISPGTTFDISMDSIATPEASSGTLIISEDQRRAISSSPGLSILGVAAKVGLQLPGRVPKVIFAMYSQWEKDGKVNPIPNRPLKLQIYYSNLVNLYILAYAKMDMDLCYAVLVRFQTTNYQPTSDSYLPDVEIAVCAFQYLPCNTPLCRWIAILYAFLWGTELAGGYSTFLKDHPGLDRSALTALFYAVAYIRDPHTMGHDNAVLARWCDVHNHAKENPWKKNLCEEMRSAISGSVDKAREMEDARMIEEAQEVISRLGDKKRDSSPASSFTKGKRKAESIPTRSIKKYKRRGGYSSGW